MPQDYPIARRQAIEPCAGRLFPLLTRPNVEKGTSRRPDSAAPVQGGLCLAFGGALLRIPCFNRVATQNHHPSPKRPQQRVIGEKGVEEVLENVRLWDGEPVFFHQPFEVLLGALLAVEANYIMQRSQPSA
jgi:hypothetical protein